MFRFVQHAHEVSGFLSLFISGFPFQRKIAVLFAAAVGLLIAAD